MKRGTLQALFVGLALLHAAVSVAANGDWQAVNVASQVGLTFKFSTDGHLCVVDADRDGLFDVVISRHGDDLWPLMRQRIDGTFVQSQLLGPKNDRHSCTVGDFASVNPNGSFGPPDGRPDFYITTGACQGECTKEYPNYLHIQRADGSFQDAAVAFGVRDPHGRGREAVTLDANLDGLDDLFFTNELSALYPDTGNHLFLNTGTGLVEWIDPGVTLSLSTVCARAFDFNDDGRTDLVVCTGNRTYFLLNTASGFVDVRASLGLSAAYRDVAFADFNADGHADLVGIEKTRLTVRLWRATAPTWGAISYTFNLTQGRTAAVGDLFGTGMRRDIYVVDGWISGDLQKSDSVLRWTGTAASPSFQAFQVPAPPLASSVAPLDGEGGSVDLLPNWAGTGRDLAVVSNGKWTAGYYQAIVMWQVAGAPSVIGLTQPAATTVITNAGLVVGTVTTQASTTVPAGSVISQNPTAGTNVTSGSAVHLVVSTGAATVAVPNVVTMTQGAATSTISGAGLALGSLIQQSSTTVPAGGVVGQSPVAGTIVVTGSAVNIVVSTGAPTATVPNVMGMTQTAATIAIANAGLVVGSVSQQPSSAVAAGKVISQNPAAGTSVDEGSALDLVVSTGAPTTTIPDVVGMSQSAAAATIANAVLVVGTVTQQSSESVLAGDVISQNPAAGTTATEGSAVSLVVSSGVATVTVPNVAGLTQQAATTAITNAGLVVGAVTQQSSTVVPAGKVISQSPLAGTSVEEGSAVDLVISTGAPTTTVPNVVGLIESAAATAITTATLVVGTVTQQSSETVPAGDVISQNPTAGTTATEGSAVDLVVSSGEAIPIVPNVVGLTQSAASTAINEADLVVGTVNEQPSVNVPAGKVISQSPLAGTSVEEGSAVDLVVSTGAPTTTVPNVVGLIESAAATAITTATLVVGTVTQQSSETVPAGDVISQNPAAGTTTTEGSAVNLVVSSGIATVTVPNVAGLTQQAATTAITNAGLVVGAVAQQSSTVVPAGKVISQNPAAGTSVEEGSALDLVVSTGAPTTTIPDVVGMSQSAAAATIANAVLVVGTVTQQSSESVPAGDVISQNPAAGTIATEGSAVSLVVSSGVATVTVPNVAGLTQQAATTAITNAGLAIGTVTQQPSTAVAAGSVINQNPAAGTSATAGTAVNLVVSTGAPTVSVPNVAGIAQSAAVTAITTAGLVVGLVTQQSSTSVSAGSVISQSPAAGVTVSVGSAVGLVVSTGAPASAAGSASPSSLAFGDVALNVAAPGKSVTITNTGSIALPISSISLAGSSAGQFSRTTSCSNQLSVGSSCTVTVVFKPTSTGSKSASLVVALGGGAGSKTVSLTGTGVNYSFTISPASLAFGSVARGATSAAKIVTVKNTGSVALPVSSFNFAGNAPTQYTRTQNCPAQLAAGATCTASVKFKPTSTGSKSATLVLTPGNGVAAKSVALSGTGT